jgi:hypothetical protein
MSRPVKRLLLAALVLALVGVLPAVAQARVTYKVSTPKLSTAPVAGEPFTVSGVITPASTPSSRATVEIKLYARAGGRWDLTDSHRASLSKAAAGTAYSCRMTVAAEGEYAVRAYHYRSGKLVKRSDMTSFDVEKAILQVHIDSNVNGWLTAALRDTVAPANTPLEVVFSTPSDWTSNDPKKNGAAHFIWGDFDKADSDGLVWRTSGLAPGRYDWMRDAMPKWGTGCLVVAQDIAIDKTSHADTHALPYLPAYVSFGDVSSEGMGCDRSIAFETRVFAQTSADPLVWYTAGPDYGSYSWKCWMDECHYGTLVVDGPAEKVTIDSDPHDATTKVTADTPLDIVFTGTRMACWRTMYFTSASDLTKTRAYPDPLTWHTDGLAAGSYEWECWMGPQCHHGTVVVQ